MLLSKKKKKTAAVFIWTLPSLFSGISPIAATHQKYHLIRRTFNCWLTAKCKKTYGSFSSKRQWAINHTSYSVIQLIPLTVIEKGISSATIHIQRCQSPTITVKSTKSFETVAKLDISAAMIQVKLKPIWQNNVIWLTETVRHAEYVMASRILPKVRGSKLAHPSVSPWSQIRHLPSTFWSGVMTDVGCIRSMKGLTSAVALSWEARNDFKVLPLDRDLYLYKYGKNVVSLSWQ